MLQDYPTSGERSAPPAWAFKRARRRLDVGFANTPLSPRILLDVLTLIGLALLPELLARGAEGISSGFLYGVLVASATAGTIMVAYGRWQARRVHRFARELSSPGARAPRERDGPGGKIP